MRKTQTLVIIFLKSVVLFRLYFFVVYAKRDRMILNKLYLFQIELMSVKSKKICTDESHVVIFTVCSLRQSGTSLYAVSVRQ